MPEELAIAGVEDGISAETGAEVESQGELEQGSQPGAETEGNQDAQQREEQQATGRKTGRANLESISSSKRDALKAIDPSLPGLIRDAVFAQKTLQREFPGGLREAVALRNAFESAGGEEGIRESQEAIADYGRLEQWFEAGDKQFVDRLAEASPEAFSAMMPSGLDAWRAKDPGMYTHIMAQVMMNTLGQNVIPVLRSAYDVLAADQKNAAAANAIADLHDKLLEFDQVSKQKPERKVNPQEQKISQREAQLNQREMRANISPVKNAGLEQIRRTIDSEMSRSFQWDTADSDTKTALGDYVKTRIVALSKKDSTFISGYNRLLSAGDWDGLKRHVTKFQARVLPGVIQQTARLFNVKPKGAKAASAVRTQSGTQTTKVAVQQGWTKVSGPPSIGQIDRSKTSQDMIIDGKAIMKDGKKVQWM